MFQRIYSSIDSVYAILRVFNEIYELIDRIYKEPQGQLSNDEDMVRSICRSLCHEAGLRIKLKVASR